MLVNGLPPSCTQYSEDKEQIIEENIPLMGLKMCQGNHCTVHRVSEFKRVDLWAYVFMASRSVVHTVGSLQGEDYSTQQMEQRRGAEEYKRWVRMEESPAGSSQHGL